MCSDGKARALLLALVLAAAPARAAGPVKADSDRKGYDFRRPEPGEILPNPAAGVGSPPRLEQFTPSASMDETGSGDTEAEAAAPPPASAAPAEPHAGAGGGGGAEGSGSGAAAAAPPPDQPPRPPRLQVLFAAEIARAGLAASPALQAADMAGDATQQADDERVWSRLGGSLAASRATWERRHPDGGERAGDAVDAVVEPGRVTLVQAPARVTGAFNDPDP